MHSIYHNFLKNYTLGKQMCKKSCKDGKKGHYTASKQVKE